MSKTKFSKKDQQKIEGFLKNFSGEYPDIRSEIASVLPAYNQLLDMHALSFEEFALQIEAKKQGFDYTDPLFSYD